MARYPALEPSYQVFQAFLRRCLLEDRSLLFPDAPGGIWTIANLELVRRRFVEGFIQGRMTFREKLVAQLSGAPPEVWGLIADSFYIYGLPTRSIRYNTKKSWVEWAARQGGLPLPGDDDPLWGALKDGFAATGQKYNLKHAQLRLLVLLALEVKALGAPGSVERAEVLQSAPALQALLDDILESIPLKLDRAYDMRNAILYLAFPDEYEPILSNRDKQAILQQYAGQVNGPLPADRDAALRQVREAIAPRFAELVTDRPFDFTLDAREEWRPGPGGLVERALTGQTVPTRVLRERGESWPAPQDPDVQRVLAALKLSRNVILTGPPGTGKTYIAQKAARALIDGQTGPLDHFIWWVTLHPSYSYEDFVEGLRPVLTGGKAAKTGGAESPAGDATAESTPAGAAYEIRPGVFRQAAERAARDPSHTYVLVIDEINRANLAKILGELITLIEDDKRGVLSARLPYSGTRFTVPPNLVLLGTMNTADRSIALLDAALRRRFAFVEIMPRPDLLAGAVVETEEAVLRLDDLLRCLNAAIREQLGADHQVGHSYFLRVARAAPEERLALLDLVWNSQVYPLLEEYFYSRPDRLADILSPFAEDGDSFSPREITRLTGEDLVVGLSRVCEGKDH